MGKEEKLTNALLKPEIFIGHVFVNFASRLVK